MTKYQQNQNICKFLILDFIIIQITKEQKMTSNDYQIKTDNKILKSQSKHQNISPQIQNSLIEMVYENGLSVYKSAKILNINGSAARTIIRRHKRKIITSKNKTRIQSKPFNKEQVKKNTLQVKVQAQNQTMKLNQERQSYLKPEVFTQRGQIYPFMNYLFAPFQMLDFFSNTYQQRRII